MGEERSVLCVVSTDAGIDDALALIFLHHFADRPVGAVVATGGNVPRKYVAANCAFLKDTFGWEAELFAGSDPPRPGAVRDAAEVHGPTGLGECRPEPADLPPMAGMVEQLAGADDDIELLVLGPATDAARLVAERPIRRRIRRITLMGGAFEPRGGRTGNVTPYAEFNVYMDPEAAGKVVRSGRPCDFVPLDATERRLFRAAELTPAPRGSRRARLVADLIDYLRRSHVRLGSGDGVFMHDVIAAAVWLGLLDVEWVDARLDRVEGEGERRGMTVTDGPGAPACRYARRVDEEAFLDLWRRVAGSL